MIWKIIDKPYAYRSKYGLSHESIFFYGKTENYMKQDHLLYPSIWDDVGFYEALGDEDTFYPSQKPQKLMRRILEMTTQTAFDDEDEDEWDEEDEDAIDDEDEDL
jgi:hypothetical protein